MVRVAVGTALAVVGTAPVLKEAARMPRVLKKVRLCTSHLSKFKF